MPNDDAAINPVCFLAVPSAPQFRRVLRAIQAAARKAHVKTTSVTTPPSRTSRDFLVGELARCDCVVTDVSLPDPFLHFQVGVAEAMAKAILPIQRNDSSPLALPFSPAAPTILYELSPVGLTALKSRLQRGLRDFLHSPSKMSLHTAQPISTPFHIDWDRLTSPDSENLCRELLTQLGFRRVDWHTRTPAIDLLAEYPRKDPDGFEYRDLWLVSMRLHAAAELLLPIAEDSGNLLDRIVMHDPRLATLWSGESPHTLTFLFIALHGEHLPSILREYFAESSRLSQHAPFFRLRYWDREYLTRLVQRFPNIGYKYFSDEARSSSQHRKGTDELHKENLDLLQSLATTNSALQEEKNRRVRAERDAVWKDIAFSAAHKLGNPIFAIETDIEPLKKRVLEGKTTEVNEVIANLFRAVDKAKGIIEQFKSLAKAQNVSPVSTNLRTLCDACCEATSARGVRCHVECPENIRIFGDTDRLTEVFDELSTNAVHWLADSREKEISIRVTTSPLNRAARPR